jgi:hypothetical protein
MGKKNNHLRVTSLSPPRTRRSRSHCHSPTARVAVAATSTPPHARGRREWERGRRRRPTWGLGWRAGAAASRARIASSALPARPGNSRAVGLAGWAGDWGGGGKMGRGLLGLTDGWEVASRVNVAGQVAFAANPS